MGRDYPAVHFFSPLPPMPTEIASHSALVLKAANQLHPVLAWTNQKAWTSLPGCEVRHFDLYNIPVAELSAKAISFYNIGNHAPFHAAIWEASRRAPGVMILHDSCLQHMFAGLSATDAGCAVYQSMMRRFYGPQGRRQRHRAAARPSRNPGPGASIPAHPGRDRWQPRGDHA